MKFFSEKNCDKPNNEIKKETFAEISKENTRC